MTQELVVIAVDSSSKAQELLLAAGQLAADGNLKIEDAVVLSKSADGHDHKLETTDLTPVEGGVGGAFWGLFLGTIVLGPVGGLVAGAVTGGAGALLAKVVDHGIHDDFVKQMQGLLEPGQSAVCLLTSGDGDREAILHQLEHFDGQLLWSDLPPEAAAEINRALAAGDAEHSIAINDRTAPPDTTSP